MKLALLFVLIFVSLKSHAFMCGADTVLSKVVETETQACITPGVCQMYELDPETGNYEYNYGFHNDCPGNQVKQTDKYSCQREDQTTYEDVNEGMWGFCNL